MSNHFQLTIVILFQDANGVSISARQSATSGEQPEHVQRGTDTLMGRNGTTHR